MNKEEIKFYSIGRGSLNINGKFYYGLDYPITDFMRMLEKENQELKDKVEIYEKAFNYIKDKTAYEKEDMRPLYESEVIELFEILKEIKKGLKS